MGEKRKVVTKSRLLESGTFWQDALYKISIEEGFDIDRPIHMDEDTEGNTILIQYDDQHFEESG